MATRGPLAVLPARTTTVRVLLLLLLPLRAVAARACRWESCMIGFGCRLLLFFVHKSIVCVSYDRRLSDDLTDEHD